MRTQEFLFVRIVLALFALLLAACGEAQPPTLAVQVSPTSQPDVMQTAGAPDVRATQPAAPTESPAGDLPSPKSRPADYPPAVEAARRAVSELSGLESDVVEVLEYEQVDWPDACLGVQTEGLMCAQVITPGYRVALLAVGTHYIYHTDLSGEHLVLAENPIMLQPNDPAEIEAARQTLEGYFLALNEARYADVVALYGGDYQVLRENNPSIDADDSVVLFRNACTINGFKCSLQIQNEVSARQVAPGEFRFILELRYPDGEPFSLGPCCGGDPAQYPAQTQFEFVVIKTDDGRFLVRDLPIYAG